MALSDRLDQSASTSCFTFWILFSKFSMVEPGEPRKYSQREIHDFQRKLLDTPQPGFVFHDHENRDDPPFVRPVDFHSNFLVDDSNPRLNDSEKKELHNLELSKWINARHSRRTWPDLYPQGKPLVHTRSGNHYLWLIVSQILLDWFWHLQLNFSFDNPYPDMSELIFRCPSDFYSGSWREHSNVWMILMNRMPEIFKDEVYESVRGVDLWSHTRRVFRSEPINHRNKRLLYTVPVSNPVYTSRCLGRRSKKRTLGRRSVIGYRTVVKSVSGRDDSILHLKTPRIHLEYSGFICKQLQKWIKNGTVVMIGCKSKLANWKDYVHHICPISIEPCKPRFCISGEAQRYTSPRKKLSCILDSIQSILKTIRPMDWLTKLDDKSGFLHLVIDELSQKLACFEFADLVFKCRGLCFGLTQSPPKFQDCNRVAQILLVGLGHRIGLYLDDRGSMEAPNGHHFGVSHTTHGCYFMLVLLTALGGFLSLDKSSVFPSHRMEFLGFGLGKFFSAI